MVESKPPLSIYLNLNFATKSFFCVSNIYQIIPEYSLVEGRVSSLQCIQCNINTFVVQNIIFSSGIYLNTVVIKQSLLFYKVFIVAQFTHTKLIRKSLVYNFWGKIFWVLFWTQIIRVNVLNYLYPFRLTFSLYKNTTTTMSTTMKKDVQCKINEK